MSLPDCCQKALERGGSLTAHERVCEHRPPASFLPAAPAPEIEPDALFDLPAEPPRGGQHL